MKLYEVVWYEPSLIDDIKKRIYVIADKHNDVEIAYPKTIIKMLDEDIYLLQKEFKKEKL